MILTQEEIKEQLVEAHRNGNWETAKVLSQQKEELKKKARRNLTCSTCGIRIGNGQRCGIHSRMHRYHRTSLNRKNKSLQSKLVKDARTAATIRVQDGIISLLARSNTREQIATMREISGKTVAYHLSNAGKRLGISGNDVAGFTRYALTKGLITLPLVMMLMVGCVSWPGIDNTKPVKITQPPLPKAPLPTPLAKPIKPTPLVVSNSISNVAKLVAPISTNKVTLAWNPSVPSDGYKIYQGSISKTYTNIYDVGNVLLGVVNAAQGTNYFAAKAYLTNGLQSGFSAEVTYFAVPKQVLLYIDTFVQTNSTLNTNLWGNVQQFPTVILTNPPSPIYGRTLIQMSYH